MNEGTSGPDEQVTRVADAMRELDSGGNRIARILRETYDQLYDGQRTGRYKWDDLYKTEKTHCGTLVEINLQREFRFENGAVLDYQIAGCEVDCKFSQRLFGWMIPPESEGQICLLLWAEDSPDPRWSAGLLRISKERLNPTENRDRKSTLNAKGRADILWLHQNAPLPPNALLQLSPESIKRIMARKRGQQRINQLFREALGMRVSRAAIATVGQQVDYMKRVRANGGARAALAREGIIILGQFHAHREIAEALGVPVPERGECVAVRVVPAVNPGPGAAEISGSLWRKAEADEPVVIAPDLPRV